MSQVEVLPAPVASNIFMNDTLTRVRAIEKLPWAVSGSPILTSPLATAEAADDVVIPGLPPVHRGHADIHLREGVMHAAELAADGEPDAEKAFFVADLSYVYTQHERWVRNLPEVQPFYGQSAAFRHKVRILTSILSRQVQPRSVCASPSGRARRRL